MPIRFLLAVLALLCIGIASADSGDSRTLSASTAGANRIALVIGNSAYQQGPLRNPVNDARAIERQLKRLGFEVILRENIKTREIGSVYREFRNKILPGGVALVFYAGHGIQFKGQNYFPAIDSDITSEEDVPLQSLNLGTLLDNMEEAKAGVSLVFLDACRDNPFARRFRSASRGLAKIEAASGTLIHYATRPGSVAADGDGANGTYTEALLSQMNDPGIPVEIMLKRVANRVVEKTGGKQEPWVEGSLRGDFYFVFQGTTTVNVQTTPTDADTEAWRMTERTDTIAAIEAYLKEYPQGRYAGAARIRLAALTKPAVPAVTTLGQAPSSDPETSLWNEVKTSGSREYLETYLKQYSKGKYAALAKVELKKLDEQEKQQKEQADQNAWDQAKAEHTPTAYMRYLQRYPTGRFAALAEPARQKALNDAIERDKAEAERKISEVQEAVKREETVHWQKAQNAKDSATVLAYLDRYPNGRYITEAKIRFDALKREEDEIRPGKVFKDCVECPEMIVIPAGSFEMGSNKVENEKPVHQVILRAFAMGKTEVTQGQWKAIMGNNPSRFDNCGDTCPVERVSWNDAKEFISKLNVKTGKTYRLPSEAEWEYACRAGGTHEFCGSDDVDSVARYFILVAGPGSVAAKEANAWGIYDMSGNVMELTEDCWNSNYSSAPTDGTARTSGDCTRRALRGGSWDAFASNSRAAKRLPGATTFRTMQIGFRVVRMLP